MQIHRLVWLRALHVASGMSVVKRAVSPERRLKVNTGAPSLLFGNVVALSPITLTLPPDGFDSGPMRRPEAAALDLNVAEGVATARRNAGGRPVVGILLAGVFVWSITASVTVPLWSAEAQIWDGYYLLLGDPPVGDGATWALSGALTGSAPVRFTTFDGLSEHPADRLAQRLDPVDPRFDPFLRSVAGYFVAMASSGDDLRLSYLRTDLPPAGVLLRLAVSSPAATLAVLDVDARRRLLAAGMVAAIALAELSVRLAAGRIAAAIAIAGMTVPWAVAVLNAGGMAVIAAAAVLPTLRRFIAGGPRAAGGAAAVIAVVTAASLLLGGTLTGLAVAVAALGSVAVALTRWRSRSTQPGDPGGRRAGAAVLSAALVALATVLATAGASVPAVRVPAPDAGDATVTWDGLARLGLWDPGRGGLPTAADYVTHVAYQEGLPYGRPYRLPAEGERLTVSSFRFDAEARRLLRYERVLATYDRRWLERVTTEAVGAGRLLLDAGSVTVQLGWLADLVRPPRQTGAAILLAILAGAAAVGAALWTRPVPR